MAASLGACGCCGSNCDYVLAVYKPFSGVLGLLDQYANDPCLTHWLKVDVRYTYEDEYGRISGARHMEYNRWTGNGSLTIDDCVGSNPQFADCAAFYEFAGNFENWRNVTFPTPTQPEWNTHYTVVDDSGFGLVYTVEITLSEPYSVADWIADGDNLYNHLSLADFRAYLSLNDHQNYTLHNSWYAADGTIEVWKDLMNPCTPCAGYAGGIKYWGTLLVPSGWAGADYLGVKTLHYVCQGTQHCKYTTPTPGCSNPYPVTTCETVSAQPGDEIILACTTNDKKWIEWTDQCTCP